MKKPTERCENCVWWADFEPRFMARISEVRGPKARGEIELRLCRFRAAPGVSVDYHEIYTDEDFSCGEFQQKEKP